MPAPHAVLLTLSDEGKRPVWSYRYTGTLPRLISFVSHSYENTGGVGVFFPFRLSLSSAQGFILPVPIDLSRSYREDPDPVGTLSGPLLTLLLSLLAATLMKLPASVANKRLTPRLNPLDATLTKNKGGPLPTRRVSQVFFHGRRYDFTNALAQRRHIFFRQTLGLDGVMQINGNFRRPQHPVARPVVPKRSHQAHRRDRNPQLLRHPEAAVLELIHVPVARPLGFRKNNQAGAAVDGVLRQPPHALQIRRPPHIRNRHVPKSLHQPAVCRDLEMRFQLPSAHKLRDGAVEYEGIEKIDVVDEEKARPAGVEAGATDDFHSRPRQKSDAGAQAALEPIVFARIQKNPQEHQRRRHKEKMQSAQNPKNGAAHRQPGFLHMKISTAAGTTSSDRHASVATSPSIMTSTGAPSLNSTWRTARREASGCLI